MQSFKTRSTGENLRALTMAGILAAMGVILQRFSISLPLVRIGIGPVPTIVSGLLLGPVLGGATGLVKDLAGFLLAPPASGSFFPPITVIQMLYGILPPLLLLVFRQPVDWLWGRLFNQKPAAWASEPVPAKAEESRGRRWLAALPPSLVTCSLVVAITQFIAGGLLMPAALSLLQSKSVTWELWYANFLTRLPQQVAYLVGYPLVSYIAIEALGRVPLRKGVANEAVLSRHS